MLPEGREHAAGEIGIEVEETGMTGIKCNSIRAIAGAVFA